MKYEFNEIACYYSKGKKLLLLPKGEFLPFGGAIGIEPVSELKFPVEKEILERKIKECFSLCWSKTVNGFPKVSIIEKYLKIKGYKKVVQQFDSFDLTYNTIDKKYILSKFFKSPDYKSYSGMEEIEMGSKIDYDLILRLIQE